MASAFICAGDDLWMAGGRPLREEVTVEMGGDEGRVMGRWCEVGMDLRGPGGGKIAPAGYGHQFSSSR